MEIGPYFLFVGISQHLYVAKIIVVAVGSEILPTCEDMRSKAIDNLLVITTLKYLIDHSDKAFYIAAIHHIRIIMPIDPIVDVSLNL